MNHIYKVIWNQTLGRFVVCSELGKKTKSNTKSIVTAAVLTSSLLLSPVMANDTEFIFTPESGNEFFNYKNWGLEANDPFVKTHGLDREKWNLNPKGAQDGPKYTFVIGQAGAQDVEMSVSDKHTLSQATIQINEGSSLEIHIPKMLNDRGSPEIIWNNQLKIVSQGHLTFDESTSCDTVCSSYLVHTATIGSQDKDNPAKLNIKGASIDFEGGMSFMDNKGVDIGTLSMGTQATFGEAEVDGGYLKLGYDGLRGAHQDRNYYDYENPEEFDSYGYDYDYNNEYVDQDFVVKLGTDQGHGKISVLNGGKVAINTVNNTSKKKFTSLDTQSLPVNFNAVTVVLSNENGLAIIGQNGGVGELLVAGENKDTKHRSTIASGEQISLGVGKDGKGSVTVTDGGTFQSYVAGVTPNTYYEVSLYLSHYGMDEEEAHELISASATRLGVDGGHGHITVSGKGSSVEIGGIGNGYTNTIGKIGEFAIGHSGKGEVTIHNLGQVRIGHVIETDDAEGNRLPGHGFVPGKDRDGNETVYGKTILATGANATGIINFTGDEYAGQVIKASEQLFTSGISVGRGQGVVNLDHNATAEQPFIFDLQVSEDFNKLYHSDFTKDFNEDGEYQHIAVDPGKISFNHLNGVTLLKAHEFRGFDSDRAKDQTTFTYSGDTNIIGGELQVKDKNLLSQKSHFNIEQAGHLNIKNADQTIKSLHNDGLLSLGQTLTRSTEFNNVLTVNGDYSGAGKIMMNTSWNTPSDPVNIMADNTSSTDQLHIKGNVKDGTKTEIAVYGGTILGDIKRSEDQIENDITLYSLPVVIVEGSAASTSFVGEAKSSQDGHVARIAHVKGEEGHHNYLWSLAVIKDPEGGNPITVPPDGSGTIPEGDPSGYIPILEEKIAVMTQMGSANNAQLTLGVGKYIERRAVTEGDPLWIRQYGQHSSLTGKNRFSYDSNVWGVQMGYDLYHGETANGTQKIGVFTGYSQNNLKFKDQYRTESGSAMISADKRVGSGKTSMLSVGGYYTWLTDTNAYVDVVGMFSHIENKYQPNDYKEFKQHGYGISLSVEGGYPIAIADTPWQIVPQGQLIYQHLNLKDKTVNDAQFQGLKDSMVLGRLGAQAMYTLDTNSYIYAGIDAWHQFDKNKAINYGNSRFQEKYNQNWVELSVGADHRLSRSVSLFGDLSYQKNMGGKKREAYKGNIGLKISF